MSKINLSPGAIATLACMLEVSAPKPGNVHRGADFEDATFYDFATSGVVLGNVIESFANQPLGLTILEAVNQTRQAVGTNTNLGMILLLVPLAKVAASNSGVPISIKQMSSFFNSATEEDAANVFEAIRIAKPGGLGESETMDVNSPNAGELNLLAAMELAADRDSVARQYTNGFLDVIDTNIQRLVYGRSVFEDLPSAIVLAYVIAMASEPDSLIMRKCGLEIAEQSQLRASKAVDKLHRIGTGAEVNASDKEAFWMEIADLDFWLRSDGNRRNPGTTADLIAASLFVGIHNGDIKPPFG